MNGLVEVNKTVVDDLEQVEVKSIWVNLDMVAIIKKDENLDKKVLPGYSLIKVKKK